MPGFGSSAPSPTDVITAIDREDKEKVQTDNDGDLFPSVLGLDLSLKQ